MISFDEVTAEIRQEHNSDWPQASLQNTNSGGSGSGIANPLLNLRNNQPDIDNIFLYVKEQPKQNYQYLINQR